jgi:hypothetical protein
MKESIDDSRHGIVLDIQPGVTRIPGTETFSVLWLLSRR